MASDSSTETAAASTTVAASSTAAAAAPEAPAEREPQNEREVVSMYSDKRQRLDQLWSKINELVAEVQEHELVIKALSEMEATRKCFRLVGDVLVERNVGETLPAVRKHMDQLVTVLEKLQSTGHHLAKDLSEFQAKYKIRIRNSPDDEDEDDRRGGGPAAPAAAQQGVLVSAK